MITPAQLSEIMPHLAPAKAQLYCPLIMAAMDEFEIDAGPERMAAFLAQLAHESVELRFFEELASGAAYEDRTDLGNNEPGDGPRYKGRGPIQLTGRRNYIAAGLALGLDLVGSPTKAADPAVGFRIAGWYWKGHGLNELADLNTQDAFDHITRKINGGLNGKPSRDAYWLKAKTALEVSC